MIDKILQRSTLVVTLLIVLCAYLFFFQSGKMALTDPDETFYAQTAKEMVARGEWVTPYLYDKPQFEKPILFYWLLEISYKIFGVNEFAARFPSAVFGTIGIIALYFLGSLLFNKRTGFLASIIMATSVEYIILSRACVTDMVLSTFMLLGALFFCCGYIKEKNYFYLLSSAAFAFATLTKGPIAIMLFGGMIVVYLLCTRDMKVLKSLPLPGIAVVFILIAAPWYALVYKLHGKAFVDAFFGFHNVTRFLQSEHKIGSQFYYNIPIVFGGFFPWSVFLPVGFWYAFKKAFGKDVHEKRRIIAVLVWFFMIFIFFTASSTKLPTYIFPSFISLALIAALVWDEFLNGIERSSALITKGTKISYYVLIAGILVAAVVAPVVVRNEIPAAMSSTLVTALFLVFGMLLSCVAFSKKQYVAAFFLIAYAVIIFLYPLSKLLVPAVEQYESSKEIAQRLIPFMKPGEKLGSESNYLGGLAFYTGVAPINLDPHEAMVRFINSNERVWAVIKDKNHRQMYDQSINPTYVKPSYLIYKVGKRAIVTNEVPPDGKYQVKRERSQ